MLLNPWKRNLMLNWTLMLYEWEKLGDKREMLEGTHSAINAQYDIKKKI